MARARKKGFDEAAKRFKERKGDFDEIEKIEQAIADWKAADSPHKLRSISLISEIERQEFDRFRNQVIVRMEGEVNALKAKFEENE